MFGKVKNALHMVIEFEQRDLANKTGIKSEGLSPQRNFSSSNVFVEIHEQIESTINSFNCCITVLEIK